MYLFSRLVQTLRIVTEPYFVQLISHATATRDLPITLSSSCFDYFHTISVLILLHDFKILARDESMGFCSLALLLEYLAFKRPLKALPMKKL